MHFSLLNSISCLIWDQIFESRVRSSLIGWMNSRTMGCPRRFIWIPSLSYGFSISKTFWLVSSKGLIINLIEWTILRVLVLVVAKDLGDINFIPYSNWGSSVAESGRIFDLIMIIVVDGWSFKSLIFGYGIFSMWVHEYRWGLIPMRSIFFHG